MQDYHVPVMLNECINALNVREGRLYLDGTLGGGGHSYEIMSHGGRIIGIDRDIQAIDFAKAKFAINSNFNGMYTLVKDNFKNARDILLDNNVDLLDGAILDLGISSRQIDDIERGFSYMGDSLLDMRMDRDQFVSAMSIVNEYSEEALSRIIYTYGEERFARKIAARIVEKRKEQQIETTKELVDIIKSCVPFSAKGGHPAKKTFQAIRIEVNGELSGLGEAVSDICGSLRSGARMCVITFHSLEDRIVKQTFKSLASDCICDKSLPVCVCNHKASVKLISAKGIEPSDEEKTNNPRSRSAKLRIVEKI